MARIDDSTLDVLADCRIDGTTLYLPDRQLDRTLYVSVNKVLESLGGKWDRKAKGHIFSDDPSDALDAVVLTGSYDKPDDLGWFETPEHIARMVIDAAQIEPGMSVLEPSAGLGALARPARDAGGSVDLCIEVHDGRAEALWGQGFPTSQRDFLVGKVVNRFDRIVMNPPFARQQDIDHVAHALRHLKPNGRLVSIMSASVLFRSNRKTAEFRETVERYGGVFAELPDGSFRSSGTNVRAVMLTIERKPEDFWVFSAGRGQA